jgi:hypothetical protein
VSLVGDCTAVQQYDIKMKKGKEKPNSIHPGEELCCWLAFPRVRWDFLTAPS